MGFVEAQVPLNSPSLINTNLRERAKKKNATNKIATIVSVIAQSY